MPGDLDVRHLSVKTTIIALVITIDLLVILFSIIPSVDGPPLDMYISVMLLALVGIPFSIISIQQRKYLIVPLLSLALCLLVLSMIVYLFLSLYSTNGITIEFTIVH